MKYGIEPAVKALPKVHSEYTKKKAEEQKTEENKIKAKVAKVLGWWKTRKEWYNKDFDSVLKTKYRTIWYGCSIRRFHSQCSRQGEHQPRREPQVV